MRTKNKTKGGYVAVKPTEKPVFCLPYVHLTSTLRADCRLQNIVERNNRSQKIKIDAQVFARKPRKNLCFAPNIWASLGHAVRDRQASGIFTAEGAESR